MSRKNRLFKHGKTIWLRWDFCQSRIWKKCQILARAKARAEIQYSPTSDAQPMATKCWQQSHYEGRSNN